MAGLLDIFGTGGTETLGLLGMSPEDIQRNRDDAQAQALYGLAARLFQGGNTGQSIAEGLQQGQRLYSAAMQNQLQDQLQGFQMKDLLEKRKREKEAEARQALIDRAIVSSYQPAVADIPAQMVEEDGRFMGETPAVAGRAAALDLQALAPILMTSAQGRKTLGELAASQKALQGETFNLAEGAKQFVRDPLTGQVREVASGAPKSFKLGEGEKQYQIDPVTNRIIEVASGAPKEKPIQRLTGNESNAALKLFQTNDPNELVKIPGAMEKISAEASKARKDTATVLYPPGALTPDKSVVKDVQNSLLESGARLSMYNQIESQFRPEYLQPKFKAGQAWSAIKEKSGANLDPNEKQALAQFSQFKQNTLNNLSQTIKALTGASMGVQEAARIEAGLPSAGQGIFDGDSPTEFKAKLDNTMRELRLVEARNAYIIRRGLSFKDVPLDNVPKLINDRAAELAKQYQVDLKKATPTQMNAIKRQLSVEFGISAD
jgi:hypothetical protein